MIWQKHQEEFVRLNASKLTDATIADELKVSIQAVRKKRQKMKLKKCRGRGVCKLVIDEKPFYGFSFCIEGRPPQ